MSWLGDLVGKAEDFLNKVDQSAAVVLQTDSLPAPVTVPLAFTESTLATKSVAKVYTPPTPNVEKNEKQQSSAASSLKLATVPRSPKAAKERANDDDKLMEFLNSSEPPKVKPMTRLTAKNGHQEADAEEVVVETVVEENGAVKAELDSAVTSCDGETKTVEVSSDAENCSLRHEVAALKQELMHVMKLNKQSELEIKKSKDKSDYFNAHASHAEKLAKELQERESDLRQALDAKDSQLAVLRVRLQEADQELMTKKELLESLQRERERILQDHNDSSGLHGQAIQTLKEKLEESEGVIERERNHFKMIQDDMTNRSSKMEEEHKEMLNNLREAQQQVATERTRASVFCNQLKASRTTLESMKRELTDYKQKAQKILQSKEKLIANLKDASFNGDGDVANSVVITMNAELEQIKQERDMLKEELQQSNGTLEQLRREMQDVESQMHSELELANEQTRHLEEQIRLEMKLKDDSVQDNSHLNEELQYYKEEVNRQKQLYQSRLSDRDKEIEKLQKQLTMKVMNNSQTELESRLHALTESLIQKQTIVEALSTEKSSLVLQLERLEQQMKDFQSYACRGSAHSVSVVEDSNIKSRIPDFLLESPFDGRVTRRVKRAYSTLDSFSVQLGLFSRRYPMVRVMVLLYMIFLHMLVVVTLFTRTSDLPR